MAQTIKLKRSSVSGNVPTPAQLELGEVAINTFDGKVFIKKDNGSESVIEVGALSGGASSLLDLTDVVSDGTFGQFLTTDGNGSFSFTSASGADAIPYTRSAVSATAGQTVFPVSYAIGFVDVYLNGVKLTLSTDYSATNGSSVTLLSPASSGDTVELVAYNGTPIEQVSLFTVSRYNFIAGNGQTTFTSYDENARNLTYTPNAIDVYLNGVLLTDSEFTATTGSSVVLTAPASTGDIIRIIDYGTAAIETGTSYATNAFVDAAIATAVSNLIDTAPATLDTLNELAAALGDDADFAGTVTTSLAAKANSADLATVATTGAYSDLTGTPTLATVATTGAYSDLTGTPTLATVATTGAYSDLTGTPTLATVATTGAYSDLTGTPTIPADVSDLTDTTSLLGGGGGSFEAVASGSLSDGSTVVLNADGTVSVVEESVTPAGPGIPAVFENASIQYTSATFDSANNTVVIAYQDEGNSNYGTAIVGTVSGKSIIFGSPVVFESASTTYISTTFDSANNKVVIAYRDGGNSSYGTAIVGTVSGTSISFGSPAVFKSAVTTHISATFDSANNKIVISYSATYGRAVVGTVSGTSISFGSEWTFVTGTATDIRTTFDSNSNKIVVSYKNSSNYLLVGVGTVSDTSISFGSFSSLGPNKGGQAVTFDSANNKIVITYTDGDNSNYGTARVGTVSGTSISFGTPVVFKNSATSAISATFDSISNKIVISHKDGSNPYYDYIIVGTVSDTSISFGSPYTFSTTGLVSISTYFYSATFDSENNKVVIAYADRGNSEYGTAVVFDTLGTAGVTNLTAENYVGISNAAYSDASTATIQTVGSIDDAQSGLTTGQAYYVQPNGTLATTPGTPSVFAGTAVSATKLLIGKEAPAATVAYADLTGNPANLVTAGIYSQGTTSYYTKQYVLNGTTTDATEGELLIAGTSSRISVPINSTMLYEVSIVARRTDVTGESASWHLKGCADNFSNTVANVGNIYEIAVASDDVTWAVDAQADDVNDSLNILVTGAVGKTIRWTAVVKTIEVSE